MVFKKIKGVMEERRKLKEIERKAFEKQKAKIEKENKIQRRKAAIERGRKKATGELYRERREKLKKGFEMMRTMGENIQSIGLIEFDQPKNDRKRTQNNYMDMILGTGSGAYGSGENEFLKMIGLETPKKTRKKRKKNTTRKRKSCFKPIFGCG
jgi:hypothetical protein